MKYKKGFVICVFLLLGLATIMPPFFQQGFLLNEPKMNLTSQGNDYTSGNNNSRAGLSNRTFQTSSKTITSNTAPTPTSDYSKLSLVYKNLTDSQVTWINTTVNATKIPSLNWVPSNDSLYENETLLTDANSTIEFTVNIPNGLRFFAFDGASQSPSISVRITIKCPNGTVAYTQDTVASSVLHKIFFNETGGAWIINFTKITTGNTTVWMQVVGENNGAFLVSNSSPFQNSFTYLKPGQAQYFVIRTNSSIDKFFMFNIAKQSGGTLYTTMYDYNNDLMVSSNAYNERQIVSPVGSGEYILTIYDTEGIDVITQIWLPKAIQTFTVTEHPIGVNQTFKFTYYKEAICYNFSINENKTWVAFTGASNTEYNSYFELWEYDSGLTKMKTYTSYGSNSILYAFEPNPSKSYLLIVLSEQTGANVTIQASWSGAERQITFPYDKYIGFATSGLLLSLNLTTSDLEWFLLSAVAYTGVRMYVEIRDKDMNQVFSDTTQSESDFVYFFKNVHENTTYLILLYGEGMYGSLTRRFVLHVTSSNVQSDTINRKTATFVYSNYPGGLGVFKINVTKVKFFTNDTPIETPHPISGSYINTWLVKIPGAKYYRLHFEKINLGYSQYLYLKNCWDITVKQYSSYFDDEDFWSPVIYSDNVTIEFRSSSSSGNAYGFKIDKILWGNDTQSGWLAFDLTSQNTYDGFLHVYDPFNVEVISELFTYSHESHHYFFTLPINGTWTIITFGMHCFNLTVTVRQSGDEDYASTGAIRRTFVSRFWGDTYYINYTIKDGATYFTSDEYHTSSASSWYYYPDGQLYASYQTSGVNRLPLCTNPLPGDWLVVFSSRDYSTQTTVTLMQSGFEDVNVNTENLPTMIFTYSSFYGGTFYYAFKTKTVQKWYSINIATQEQYHYYDRMYVNVYAVEHPTHKSIVTDSSWLSNETATGSWTSVDYDDSGWHHADENHRDYPIPRAFYGTSATWIWSSPNDEYSVDRYFRKTFYINDTFETATLKFMVDNTLYLYVNGHYIGYYSSTEELYEISLTSYLHVGKNVIAVKVHESSQYEGFIGLLTIEKEQTNVFQLSTTSLNIWTHAEKAPEENAIHLVRIYLPTGANISFTLWFDSCLSNYTLPIDKYISANYTGDAAYFRIKNQKTLKWLYFAFQNVPNWVEIFIYNTTFDEKYHDTLSGAGDRFLAVAQNVTGDWVIGLVGYHVFKAHISISSSDQSYSQLMPGNHSITFSYYGSVLSYKVVGNTTAEFISVDVIDYSDGTSVLVCIINDTGYLVYYKQVKTEYTYIDVAHYFSLWTTQNYTLILMSEIDSNATLSFAYESMELSAPVQQKVLNFTSWYPIYLKFDVPLSSVLTINMTLGKVRAVEAYLHSPEGKQEKIFKLTQDGQTIEYTKDWPTPGYWYLIVLGRDDTYVNLSIGFQEVSYQQLPINVTIIKPRMMDIVRDVVEVEVQINYLTYPYSTIAKGLFQLRTNNTGHNVWFPLTYDSTENKYTGRLDTTMYPDGLATLTVFFIDQYNRTGADSVALIIDNSPQLPDNWSFIVDRDPPSIIVGNLENGSVVSKTITLHIYAFDETNVTSVEVSETDGASWTTLTYNDTLGYYPYTWDTLTFTGDTLMIRATDFWGYTSTVNISIIHHITHYTYGYNIYIDNEPPDIVSVTYPHTINLGDTLEITAEVHDLSNVSVSLTYTFGGKKYSVEMRPVGNDKYKVEIKDIPAPGQIVFNITAVDEWGYSTTSNKYYVNVEVSEGFPDWYWAFVVTLVVGVSAGIAIVGFYYYYYYRGRLKHVRHATKSKVTTPKNNK